MREGASSFEQSSRQQPKKSVSLEILSRMQRPQEASVRTGSRYSRNPAFPPYRMLADVSQRKNRRTAVFANLKTMKLPFRYSTPSWRYFPLHFHSRSTVHDADTKLGRPKLYALADTDGSG